MRAKIPKIRRKIIIFKVYFETAGVHYYTATLLCTSLHTPNNGNCTPYIFQFCNNFLDFVWGGKILKGRVSFMDDNLNKKVEEVNSEELKKKKNRKIALGVIGGCTLLGVLIAV